MFPRFARREVDMVTITAALDRASLEIHRSTMLMTTFPPLFAEATALLKRSRDLCVVSRRRIRGGTDLESPFIVEVIARTPLCLDCLARKTGIQTSRAVEAMNRIRGFMHVTEAPGRCSGCQQITHVFGLDGANGSPPTARPAPTQNGAIWRFLEAHRGQMFCTLCIAKALDTTKRIDRAILAAEGRGARRLHGPCVSCGKERLLCGLMP